MRQTRLLGTFSAAVAATLFLLAALLGGHHGQKPAPSMQFRSVFTQSGVDEYQLVALTEVVFENMPGHMLPGSADLLALIEANPQNRVSPRPAPMAKALIPLPVVALPPCQDCKAAAPLDDRPMDLALARSGRKPTGPPTLV